MPYRETATIMRNADGTFKFDNGRNAVTATNADDAGALLEQQLWPLLQPLLVGSASVIKIVVMDD